MNPVLKNILAVIAGWLGGSIINMGLVKIRSYDNAYLWPQVLYNLSADVFKSTSLPVNDTVLF